MKLDRLTFYENRFKCLNTQSVQGRGTVEHNRMILDNAFQHIPYLRTNLFDHSLCTLDIMCIPVFNQLFHDERLEEFQSHLLRKSALVESQFRTYYDYGTS